MILKLGSWNNLAQPGKCPIFSLTKSPHSTLEVCTYFEKIFTTEKIYYVSYHISKLYDENDIYFEPYWPMAMGQLLWTSPGHATIALNQFWPCDKFFEKSWSCDNCFGPVLAMRQLLWTSLGHATIALISLGHATIALNQSWPWENCFELVLAMRQLLWISLGHGTIPLLCHKR